jgi:arylsulfatase A-like enzyme
VVDALVEHIDVPATVRDIAGAPDVELSEGRSLLASVHDPAAPPSRSLTVSENWGFAAFETARYKLVVDEDALEPCQLFDLSEDAAEDHDLLPDPAEAPVVEEIMETHVRPFFQTPPARPIPSIFTGGYDT